MENAPQVIDTENQVVNFETYMLTAERIQKQVNTIQEVMQQVMRNDEHYGIIPGTEKKCPDCKGKGCAKCNQTGDMSKPSLLKPGAEKLSLTFQFAPSYEIKRNYMNAEHREYEIICILTQIQSGQVMGQGVGSCSTMESKYRYRKAEQKCPECGKETIIKGKQEYGGGWLCWGKKGGCGAKFKDGDPQIENQDMGRVEYDNPADYYNTILKIAKKRAHVDAVLTVTAASDIFTQDIEDMSPETVRGNEKPKTKNKLKPKNKPKPPKEIVSEPENGSVIQEQLNAIYAKGAEFQLSKKEVQELGKWFRKGDKMTSDEANHVIRNFGQVMDDYLEFKSQQSSPPDDDIPY